MMTNEIAVCERCKGPVHDITEIEIRMNTYSTGRKSDEISENEYQVCRPCWKEIKRFIKGEHLDSYEAGKELRRIILLQNEAVDRMANMVYPPIDKINELEILIDHYIGHNLPNTEPYCTVCSKTHANIIKEKEILRAKESIKSNIR